MTKIKNLGKKTNSVLGIFTVVCGFVMMWASSLGGSATRASFTSTLKEAVDIDASRPSPRNNGRIVVAAGHLRGDAPLEDEFLLPQTAVRLVRHVEMFQWVEYTDEKPSSSGVVGYSLEWASREIDFFQFREPTGHENPVMKVRPLDKKPAVISFGAFDGARIVDAIETLYPLQLKPEMLKDRSQVIEDNKLLVKREADRQGVSLGDMRVWYEVLPSDQYTVLARQVDEMSLIGSRPMDEVVIQRGGYTADELFEEASRGAKKAYTGMLFLGALLMTFGFVSALKPHADRFDLNPKLDVKGMQAVVLVSVGISCALMAIFMVLAWVG
jgi:hypothetical protein